MLAVIATLPVKPEAAAEFEAAFAELAAEVRKEEGNRLYQLARKRDAEGVYVVMELYTDQDALDLHGKTPHFGAFFAKAGGMLAGKPVIEMLDTVG